MPCALYNAFEHDRASCQIHRVDWGEVVVLSLQRNEYGKRGQIAPAKCAVGFEACGEQESEHSAYPERGGKRLHDQDLLREVRAGGKHHVAAVSSDIAH